LSKACARRDGRADASAYGSWCWLGSAADDVNIRWMRELTEVMRPFTTGSDYVNEIKPMRGGAHQGRLPGELRAARGSEEQIRPDEPVPS
jgi:hypothetical protein